MSDPSGMLRGMEMHRSVREARRTFAEILSTAAYGDKRVVIVRHRTEVGAFVNMDDLEFLRRYRPGEESTPAPRELQWELDRLAFRYKLQEKAEARPDLSDEHRQQLAADRELLDAERAWLQMLLALAKKGEKKN